MSVANVMAQIFKSPKHLRLSKGVFFRKVTPVAKAGTTTLTPADLLSGIIEGTHATVATANYTLPTGALLQAAISPDIGVGEGFEWSLVNLSAGIANVIAIVANTGHSFVGVNTVPSTSPSTGGTVGHTIKLFTRKTADATFETIRIGG